MTKDRYKRGLETLREICGTGPGQANEKLKEIAPDFARHIIEFAYGDIYSRPGLDLKTREIVSVTVLVTLGNATDQLKAHIANALSAGCTHQEIVECLMQIGVYAGIPAAVNGLYAAKEVFQEQNKEERD